MMHQQDRRQFQQQVRNPKKLNTQQQQNLNKDLTNQFPKKDSQQGLNLNIQNTIFRIKDHQDAVFDTIFVPVYPRAYIEEVIGIDFDRRTVTAHFVIHITVYCKVNDQDLKKFLREHLILQFGYNQTIYIPQIMKKDNPFCIITQVVQHGNLSDYMTYKIRGNFECSAHFDLMLFPFRQIEVLNHLVIRTQHFNNYQIKYNAMVLDKSNVLNFNQFSPHITFPEFAGYRIQNFSTQMSSDQSKYQMKINSYRNGLFSYVSSFFRKQKQTITKPQQISKDKIYQNIIEILGQKKVNDEKLQAKKNEFSPFKHVLFKFEMISLKLAFVLQNEIPIWVLAVLSLYTFTSRPDIGNRYGNIVLLIVSYVGLFINFRVNNVGHSAFTFYEIKLITILVVPILLIISTVKDYYSNTDPNLTDYALRKNQLQNPFLLTSMIIVLVTFFLTLVFLLKIAITKYWCLEYLKNANRNESQSMWENLIELDWKQPTLQIKMSELAKNKNSLVFEIVDQQLHQTFKQQASYRISKKLSIKEQ